MFPNENKNIGPATISYWKKLTDTFKGFVIYDIFLENFYEKNKKMIIIFFIQFFFLKKIIKVILKFF